MFRAVLSKYRVFHVYMTPSPFTSYFVAQALPGSSSAVLLPPVHYTPQVSAEMIRELGLSDEELGPISLTITNLAEKARRRRMRRTSSTSSVAVSQVSALFQ